MKTAEEIMGYLLAKESGLLRVITHLDEQREWALLNGFTELSKTYGRATRVELDRIGDVQQLLKFIRGE